MGCSECLHLGTKGISSLPNPVHLVLVPSSWFTVRLLLSAPSPIVGSDRGKSFSPPRILLVTASFKHVLFQYYQPTIPIPLFLSSAYLLVFFVFFKFSCLPRPSHRRIASNGAMATTTVPATNPLQHVDRPQAKSKSGALRYPFWFGGSAASMAAVVTHPLDLSMKQDFFFCSFA